MMVDSLATSVMILLGKYAVDKGVNLAKEVGPAAAQKAGDLFQAALDYLRRRPQSENIASEYEQDPETYEKPMEKKLFAAVQTDAAFSAQLKELLAAYEATALAYRASTTISSQGSGAISQGSGDALGERAVLARDVQGPIVTGSQNIIYTGRPPASSVTLPPTLALMRDKLVQHFDKRELNILCFDLGLAYDDLPGETRTELAQALVEYCHRHNRLPDLIVRCQSERPQIEWA
jgi:hypothetical protein